MSSLASRQAASGRAATENQPSEQTTQSSGQQSQASKQAGRDLLHIEKKHRAKPHHFDGPSQRKRARIQPNGVGEQPNRANPFPAVKSIKPFQTMPDLAIFHHECIMIICITATRDIRYQHQKAINNATYTM